MCSLLSGAIASITVSAVFINPLVVDESSVASVRGHDDVQGTFRPNVFPLARRATVRQQHAPSSVSPAAEILNRIYWRTVKTAVQPQQLSGAVTATVIHRIGRGGDYATGQ